MFGAIWCKHLHWYSMICRSSLNSERFPMVADSGDRKHSKAWRLFVNRSFERNGWFWNRRKNNDIKHWSSSEQSVVDSQWFEQYFWEWNLLKNSFVVDWVAVVIRDRWCNQMSQSPALYRIRITVFFGNVLVVKAHFFLRKNSWIIYSYI